MKLLAYVLFVASVPYLSSSPNAGAQRVLLSNCAIYSYPPALSNYTGLLSVVRLSKPFPTRALHQSVPWPAYTRFLRFPGLQTELTWEIPLCLPLAPQFSVLALRGFPADLHPLLVAVFHLSWCVNSMKAKPTWAVFPLSFAGISPAPGI